MWPWKVNSDHWVHLVTKAHPTIDWKTGDIKFTRYPQECNVATKKRKQKKALAFKYKASVEEIDEEAKEKECEDDEETEDDIYLRVLEHIREVEKKVEKKTDEEMVPPQFHVYLNVFKKAPSERLTLCKPWDHAINLNPDFVTTFSYSEILWHLYYSLLWPDCSQLIPYDILTVLSVSLTVDFPLIDYFSHDYSSWLIPYNILSQIDLVCLPDPLVYKPSVQTVFFSFDLG